MTTFIVDWQSPKENSITELNENHFKFNPLNISTKNGSNFEMDARIIMEIDDDSAIVKLFGSVPVFVDNILSILVRNFFTYKEITETTSYRLKIQEEFLKLAQEKLTKYGVKINTFMISFITKDKKQKTAIEKTRSVKDKCQKEGVNVTKVPENPYRKGLAGMYIQQCMGKPEDEYIKKAVNGSNEDLSLDYYLGAERIINNTIMVFREMDQKQLKGAGGAFSMMLFYISYEIENRSAFQSES